MGLECYSLLVEWSINAVLVATFFSYLCFEAYSHKSLSAFLLILLDYSSARLYYV